MKIGQSTLSRRSFLMTALAPLLLQKARLNDPWSEAPSILARIKPPVFPARDFNITQFGATAGEGESTDAIAKAIAACSAAGGGRVVIPTGEFLTGPIRLKS